MRITVGLKLYGIVLLLLALMTTVAVLSVARIGEIAGDLDRLVHREMPAAELATRLNLLILRQSAALTRLLLLHSTTPRDPDEIAATRADYRGLAEAVTRTVDAAHALADHQDPQVRAFHARWVERIAAEQTRFHGNGGLLLTLLERGDTAAFRRHYRSLIHHETRFHQAVAALREGATRGAEARAARAEEEERTLAIVNGLLAALAAALGLLIAGIVAAGIVRRVGGLAVGARSVREGDLETTVAVEGRDEIAELSGAFNEMTDGLRLKERIKETFGKYMDPRIVRDLIERPEAVEAAGSRRQLTVLFADIRGFSAIAERLPPEQLVALLNACFNEMAEPVAAHQGVIDKFIGDALMAFWGEPFTDPDAHAAAACLAALGVVEAIERFRDGAAADRPAIDLRIGLASGEALVGSIGSRAARNYTVMGDTVNLASRLEGANKEYGTRILISEETRRQAGAAVEVREVDTVRVVGREEPVRVFELLAPAGGLDAQGQGLREAYQAGLAAYRRGAWEEAEGWLRSGLQRRPGDGPATTLLARIARLRETPPADHWAGVWSLTGK